MRSQIASRGALFHARENALRGAVVGRGHPRRGAATITRPFVHAHAAAVLTSAVARAHVVVVLHGAQVRGRQVCGQMGVVQLGGAPAYVTAPAGLTNARVLLADTVARAFVAFVLLDLAELAFPAVATCAFIPQARSMITAIATHHLGQDGWRPRA